MIWYFKMIQLWLSFQVGWPVKNKLLVYHNAVDILKYKNFLDFSRFLYHIYSYAFILNLFYIESNWNPIKFQWLTYLYTSKSQGNIKQCTYIYQIEDYNGIILFSSLYMHDNSTILARKARQDSQWIFLIEV